MSANAVANMVKIVSNILNKSNKLISVDIELLSRLTQNQKSALGPNNKRKALMFLIISENKSTKVSATRNQQARRHLIVKKVGSIRSNKIRR